MPSEFDQILRKTLEDYRLSRGERRVLSQILGEIQPDDQQLAFLRHRAFAIAREETASPNTTAVLKWLEEVAKVLAARSAANNERSRAEAWFSPDDNCVEVIISRLKRTKQTADICVFTITDDRISDTLHDCHRRGIKLRIITDDDKSEDQGSDVDRLERAGIPLRVDRSRYHMHHKFALFDRQTLLTGSYNWTRSANEVNEENFVISNDQDLVKCFSRQFEKLWEHLQ